MNELDFDTTTDQADFSPRLRSIMKSLSGWSLVAGIIGTLAILPGIIFLLLIIQEAGNRWREDEIIGLFIFLVGFAFVIFLTVQAFRARRLLKSGINNKESNDVASGLATLRTIMAVLVVLIGLGVSLMLFVGAVALYFTMLYR